MKQYQLKKTKIIEFIFKHFIIIYERKISNNETTNGKNESIHTKKYQNRNCE